MVSEKDSYVNELSNTDIHPYPSPNPYPEFFFPPEAAYSPSESDTLQSIEPRIPDPKLDARYGPELGRLANHPIFSEGQDIDVPSDV